MANGNEDVARSLGAGGAEDFTINGKRINPRPLTLKEITELQRDCVSQYRMRHLTALKQSAELIYDTQREAREYLTEHALATANWDIDDLPYRDVYDTTETVLTDELEFWAVEKIPGYDVKKSEKAKRRFIAFALDAEILSDADYLRLTGKPVNKIKTSYVNWWITATPEGMLSMVWHMIKGDGGFSKEELELALAEKQGLFAQMSRSIESLTTPAAEGNG